MATMDQLVTAFRNARKAGDEAAAARLAKAIKAMQQKPVDRSFTSAFQQGLDAPLENMATTARMLGAEGTADTLSGLTDAPENYESAANRFINPQEGDFTIGGFAPGYLPRAAVEQAGQLAGSIATRAGGGVVGGLVTGGNPIGITAGALAGPALFEFVQQLGPIAQERARNNGRDEPEWDDWSAAAAAAGLSGALNAIGVRGGSGASFLNKTLREGVTEGSQSVVEQTGSTAATEAGLEISPKQAIGEGIIGGTTAGGFDVAGRTAKGATRLFTGDNEVTDQAAAADLAQRLNTIAAANNLNLKDIEKTSTKGAREAVDKAHVQLSEELKQVARDLRSRLGISDTDELSVVIDKVMATAGQREARNKTKNTVGRQEMDAIERLTGDTAEGRQMLSLMRQMNELTELHNSGYQGGVSKITDQFMPFGTNIGYDRGAIATERLLRPLVSGGAAIQTGGASLAGQAALAGAGRGIDALTGRRSRVARYLKQNLNQPGIEQDDLPSLRQAAIDDANQAEQERLAAEQQAQLEQAQKEQLNRNLAQRNAPPQPDSPQGRLEAATGLDRNGAARIIRMIENTELGNDPVLKRAIQSYRKNVDVGGYVTDLTPLIRAVKAMQDSDPRIDELRVRPRDDNAAAAQQQLDARIEQGKRDNQRFNDDLAKALNADKTVDAQTKAIGAAALGKLRLDLGRNPLSSAQAHLEDAVRRAKNPAAIEQYVAPYVQRVAQQQKVESENETVVADQAPVEMGNVFEGVNNPMRVSTRVPTATNRFEDPLSEDLQVDMAAIRAAPGKTPLIRKMLKRLNAYEGQKGWRRDNKGRPADQHFKDFVKSNLLYLYNSVSPEYRERAKQWYVGANRLSQDVADRFGLELPQVAGVMAALSPQQDWYQNYDIGVRVIDTFLNRQNEVFSTEMENKFLQMIENQPNPNQRATLQKRLEFMRGKQLSELDPTEAAIFVRFHDEVNNPEGKKHRVIAPEGTLEGYVENKDGSPGSIRFNAFGDVTKAIKMIQDGSRENISTNLGNRHKVRSFYNNILNPMSDRGDVTIDTHAVAAGLLQPLGGSAPEVAHNLGTAGDTSAITGVMGSYGIYADAYREAAAEVGILPREMQSITWEALRGLFTNFKTPKNNRRVKDIWKKYDKGTISLDEARGEINAIAGGIERAAWERPDGTDGTPGRDRSQSTEVRGAGDARGVLSLGVSGGRPGTVTRDSSGPSYVLPPSQQNRNVAEDTPLGAAIRETLGPDYGFAPNSRISGSRPATPTEVEEQLRIVEKLVSEGKSIEIGKEGGAFENGIRSLQAIKRIAQAMNISFVLANDMAQMRRLKGKGGNMVGFYRKIGSRPTPVDEINPEDNIIAVLRPGAKTPLGMTMTIGESTFTAAHELGHALSMSALSRGLPVQEIGRMRKLKTGKPTSDSRHIAYENSFEGEIAKIIKKKFGKNPDAIVEMLDELVAIQRTGMMAVIEGSPAVVREGYIDTFNMVNEQSTAAGLTPARAAEFVRTKPQARKMLTDSLDSYEDYTQRAAELAADLVGIYIIDPKFMKEVAPKSARFARVFLNYSDLGQLVTFFSAPFAAILAAIMANMLVAEGEEEEEQMKGILSPQPGALTA